MPGRSPAASAPAPDERCCIASEAREPRRRALLLISGALVVITLVVFAPTLHGELLDWDDRVNLVENPHFRGLTPAHLRWMFTSFHLGHYQPLTWVSFAFDWMLWGLNPFGYHLTNVALHAFNVVLFFLLTLELLHRMGGPRDDPRWRLLGATLAALLFGLHPLRVENVAWVTERRDMLSGLFLLAATLVYVRAVPRPGADDAGPADGQRAAPATGGLAAVYLLATLALLSKVIAVVLPAILLVLDWYPLGRLRPLSRAWRSPAGRRAVLEKLPLLVLALPFGLLALTQQAAHGSLHPLHDHPLHARLVVFIYGLAFYLGQALLPVALVPLYPLRLPVDPAEPRFVVAMLVVGSLALMLVLLRRRFPGLIAAACCYVICLLPVQGLVQTGPQIAADRYTYLALLSWTVAGGWALTRLLHRWPPGTMPGRAALGVMAAVVATLALLSARQCAVWRTTETLWLYTGPRAMDSSVAAKAYGSVLLERGQVDEAIAAFRRAIALKPANAGAHHGLWSALLRQGRTDELIVALEHGLSAGITPAQTHFFLANALAQRGELEAAIEHHREALRLEPRYLEAHTNLASCYAQRRDFERAIQHCLAALEIDPGAVPARLNLALLYEQTGRLDQAIAQLRELLRRHPDQQRAQAELRRMLERASSGP